MHPSWPAGFFPVIAFCLLFLAGCDTAPRTSDKDLQHVDYRQLKEWIAAATDKRPLALVDTRNRAQYEAGHLPGAINIPLGELHVSDSRFRNADKIVCYHESFTGLYADLAAKKLIAGGIYNVFSYGGGYMDWKKREEREEP